MAHSPFPAAPSAEARLFVSRLLARMGVEVSYFIGVFGTATYTMGADAFAISGMMLVGNLFIVVGTALAGPVVDRVGPRRCLMGSLGLTACIFAAYALVDDSMGLLVAFLACWSLFIGFTNTGSTYPPYLVGEEGLKRCNGLMSVATYGAIVAGPVLGAAVCSVWSVKAVFPLAALFFAAAVAVTGANPERRRPDAAPAGEGTAEGGRGRYLLEGFRATFTSRTLALLFLLGFFGYFSFGAFDSLESIFYRDVLAVPVEFLGWLTAAVGLGCVCGSVAMMRLPRERLTVRACALMLCLVGVGSVVYVGTGLWQVAAVGQFLCGLGFGMLGPTRDMLVQEMSSLDVCGRVVSVMQLGLQLAGVVPLFFAPFLAEAFGVQPVLVCAAVVAASVGAGFYLAVPRVLGRGARPGK
ncbi:MFS transporter [Caniella muris]|uniref:MFS transporter n=1 Tax=Caniella muris TaxID=2941502 RepID=UPI00204091E0|nr:MFS transporter [Caniella muris]